MRGARRHWPDVRVEMAMDVLSCRITGREIRDRSIQYIQVSLLTVTDKTIRCESLLFFELPAHICLNIMTLSSPFLMIKKPLLRMGGRVFV